ncbi:hypothetical protein [Mycobacterium saskatchewanense]|uniref:hypothetical protein n=1 Tax=Mycobacterium saskatchewanense TaxID=220927 RepID=UPI0013027736|nr:hypothetical protein [Mycobacterium saskatchewanense]
MSDIAVHQARFFARSLAGPPAAAVGGALRRTTALGACLRLESRLATVSTFRVLR